MAAVLNKNRIGAPSATVTVEPLANLDRYWRDSGNPLNWDCLFMLPPWLSAWRSYSARSLEVQLYVVRLNGAVIGVAPLMVSGNAASLVSDSELIDYSDFVVAPSREIEFFTTLFDYLRREGVGRLDIPRVRADSETISFLSICSPDDCEVSRTSVDIFYEMDLPDTWEGYLDSLNAKERHETRRKLRRLESAGRVGLRVIENTKDVSDALSAFVRLFRSNRPEKAQFMTDYMESFFGSLAAGMAKAGGLKIFFLDLEDKPVAASMCFDYHSAVYLYNNGYDLRFAHLSVGLLCKVFSIRESIRLRRAKYNFLRGGEIYKGRMGGRPVNLLHCEVTFK
ncbi:MAG TPA: GNAT family N-acetyltransferase [Thermodesulfovibrionales bacterium]|nr:GNAT family N-acetyltransferase [Thermodesulfovibrionales bacterium]